MVAQAKRQCARVRQLGLSIVEFMVAILIGMIVLAGVLQVVISSKSTFLGQEEMSFIQENARFALDIIGRDIQSAGYWGCAGTYASLALTAKIGAGEDPLLGPEPIIGFEGDGNNAGVFPALYSADVRPVGSTTEDLPDSIIVRTAAGNPFTVAQNQDSASITLAVKDGEPGIQASNRFQANDYVTVVSEDCRRAGVIRLAGVAGNTVSYSSNTVCLDGEVIKPAYNQLLQCDSQCNCKETATGNINERDAQASTNRHYFRGATVMDYSASAYYIGTSNAAEGQPALKRMVLTRTGAESEELALGVEDLEILYGLDTDSNKTIDTYVKADEVLGYGGWSQVYAVRVSLVFRSQAPSLPQSEVRENLVGNDYNDRYMRQAVTATYRLRNRT